MALVDLKAPMFYPGFMDVTVSNPSLSNLTLSNIGAGYGIVMQSPVTDTITKVAIRTANINAATLEVRVETVDLATGLPTGTLWAANTNGTVTTLSTDDNTVFEVTLTSAASVNKGDLLAITVTAQTASAGGMNAFVGNTNLGSGFPYPVSSSGAGWSRQATLSANMAVYYGTAGYMYNHQMVPISSNTTHTFNNTSTPDVYGMKITPEMNCKIDGVKLLADIDGDIVVKLYDTDGQTVLASGSNDADLPPVTTASVNYITFNTAITLSAGASYYIGVEPSTATNMSLYSLTFWSSTYKNLFVGSEAVYATSKDPESGGAWTANDAQWLVMWARLVAIDNGAGGGGGGGNTYSRGRLVNAGS